MMTNKKYSDVTRNFFGMLTAASKSRTGACARCGVKVGHCLRTRRRGPPFSHNPVTLPPGVLAENNRLPQSKEIIAAFEEIMAATRSEVACKVVSAQVRALGRVTKAHKKGEAETPCKT